MTVMGVMWVDDYNGSQVDPETLDLPELHRIADCLRQDLEENGNWPEQVEWLEGQLAEIEEIVEAKEGGES